MYRKNGHSSGPTDDGLVLRSEFSQAMDKMAQVMAKDINSLGLGLRTHNDILQSFEAAHNAVAETAESNSITLRFVLEKMGMISADGTPSSEYTAWYEAKKQEIADLRAKAEEQARMQAGAAPLAPVQ